MRVRQQIAGKTVRRAFVRYKDEKPAQNRIEVERIINGVHDFRDFPPVLSLIIPTSDGHRNGTFPALLSQIREQSFQNFETIVVKGDSKQGRAINTGVDLARGKYILTLDDDTSLQNRNAFSLLVEVMENHKDIGMAGGINVIPSDASPFVTKVMREIPRRSTPRVEKITDSDLAEHPLLIMRKEDFKAIGGENELIPRGLDPYLRQKFRQNGFRVVVVPDAFYSHLPPSNIYALIRQFFRNGCQAAFCNKFYPQWVIETPDCHGNRFITKRPLHFRVARFVLRMIRKAVKGHFIYFVAFAAYSTGFIWGYLNLTQRKSLSV